MRTEESLLVLVIEGSYWSSYVSHSWRINRRSKDRDVALKNVGIFATKSEAIKAATDAIEKRTVGPIEYASARPFVSFDIDRKTMDKIGELLDGRAK